MRLIAGLILLLSCSAHNKQTDKIKISITVKFDARECGDVIIDRLDIGKSFDWLQDENHDHGPSDEKDTVVWDQPNTMEVKRILTVPVKNNEASFEIHASKEELSDLLICPPILSEHSSPYDCFQPVGDIDREVKISIRMYGKDCDHYKRR